MSIKAGDYVKRDGGSLTPGVGPNIGKVVYIIWQQPSGATALELVTCDGQTRRWSLNRSFVTVISEEEYLRLAAAYALGVQP